VRGDFEDELILSEVRGFEQWDNIGNAAKEVSESRNCLLVFLHFSLSPS
jgi:hypothetical protein